MVRNLPNMFGVRPIDGDFLSQLSNEGILRYLSELLDGWEFEHVVADLWEARGYETEVTQKTADMGIDVTATKDELISFTHLIQAKKFKPSSNVSAPDIAQYASLNLEDNGDAVVVVTTGGFTTGAREIASGRNVHLIDGETLVTYLREYDVLETVAGRLSCTPPQPRYTIQKHLRLGTGNPSALRHPRMDRHQHVLNVVEELSDFATQTPASIDRIATRLDETSGDTQRMLEDLLEWGHIESVREGARQVLPSIHVECSHVHLEHEPMEDSALGNGIVEMLSQEVATRHDAVWLTIPEITLRMNRRDDDWTDENGLRVTRVHKQCESQAERGRLNVRDSQGVVEYSLASGPLYYALTQRDPASNDASSRERAVSARASESGLNGD